MASADMMIVQSPVDNSVTVRFKEPPAGTCTTVFSTQRQYSGYITLPANVLTPSQGNYTINTFFWFIEARQLPEAAPLTIYINGGPGSSSMVGLFQEVGPCEVVELSKNQLGTQAREWGWDRSSNILFIDQPVQVGLSYDTLTNASLNLLNGNLTYPPAEVPSAQPAYTFLNGTFSSGNPYFSANTSQLAAQSVWHFLQAFLGVFPQYNPANRTDATTDEPLGINLWTESYGGKYAPAMATFFEQQNVQRSQDPAFANLTVDIRLLSVGIINGWVDLYTQMPVYPLFAYNNSYGLQLISQVDELNALSAYSSANGCQQLTATCRALEANLDSQDQGNVAAVNEACAQAETYCQEYVLGVYTSTGRSIYDISQNVLDPFPESFYLEYLNSASVQQAIGASTNFTQSSQPVFSAFLETGDYARDGILTDLVSLLNAGIRIALVYGDRDYACNWVGGEAVSFAIAGAAQPNYASWYTAGYVPIVVNSSYIGGVVRQYGNLSFSRVYDAGHLVPAYQAETAFTIFSRVIEGTDVSLGTVVDLSTYESTGDSNATYVNNLPAMSSPTCYLRAVNSSCNTDQRNMLANYAGVIINGILYNDEAGWTSPASSITTVAGVPGTPPVSMYTSAPPPFTTTALDTMGGPGSSVAQNNTAASRGNGEAQTGHSTTGLPTGVYTATSIPTTSTKVSSQADFRGVAFGHITSYFLFTTSLILGHVF